MTSKYEKWNITATTGRILLKFETSANWNKPEETGVSNEDDLQWRKKPPAEDDLEIRKLEYLINHWLDLTQIWNLSYWDQTKVQ